jgi:hypothetical protein
MKRDASTWLWVLAAVGMTATLALQRAGDRAAGGGALVDVVALGAGEAAIVYTERLELAGADGRTRWSAAIPRQAHAAPNASPHARLATVVADGERVYVRGRGSAQRGPELVALSRASGAELWRSQHLEDTPDEVGLGFDHDRVRRAVTGSSLIDAYRYDDGRGGGWVLLAATAPATGQTIWRARLGPDSRGPMWVRGEHLVFGAQGVLHVFRASDGAPVNLVEGAAPICVFDSDLVYARGESVVVASIEGTTSAHIPVAEALEDIAPGSFSLRACARFEDAFVLAVEAGDRVHLISLAGPLAEHAGGFELRWRLDLGAAALPAAGRFDDIGARHPDRGSLAGELPRHVAIKLGRDELAMIDVAAGELAWRAKLDGRQHVALYAHGGDALLYDPQAGLLARFAGDTGKLAAAVRVEGARFTAHQLADGGLFLHRDGEWTYLDDRHLRPRPPHEPAWVSPVSAEALAAELELPAAAIAE